MIEIERIPASKIKIPLPDVFQLTPYSCGASALQSILLYYDKGPIEEKAIRKIMNMTHTGTDPYMVRKVIKKFGLNSIEYRGMTTAQLKKSIDARRPVMIMLQAWGKHPKKYSSDSKDGHWLVAIGYDKENFYFEDPSLDGTIGSIKISELDARWHDIESYNAKSRDIHFTDHYGIAIWGDKIAEKTVKTRKTL